MVRTLTKQEAIELLSQDGFDQLCEQVAKDSMESSTFNHSAPEVLSFQVRDIEHIDTGKRYTIGIEFIIRQERILFITATYMKVNLFMVCDAVEGVPDEMLDHYNTLRNNKLAVLN